MKFFRIKKYRLALMLILISALITTTGVAAATDSWQNIGPAGFSAGTAGDPSMALDGSTPYVAYSDGGYSFRATVMRYNGTSWETVGPAGFTTANSISLALDGSTPYVAYQDGIHSYKTTVMRYNGTSWETVGPAGFSAGTANYISLALDGSTPYVAFRDYYNSQKATVMRYNGMNWETVGMAGFTAGTASYISLALDGSTPYVACRDGGNSDKATVMRYNGTSWETVGSDGFSTGTASYTSIALDGSTPYIAYRDGDYSFSRVTVKKYNGTSWETVGPAGFSAGTTNSISLALNGSTPYVAYQDGGISYKATVKRYNGTSWETVGSIGFSAGTVYSVSLALDGSTPYVAYQDGGNASKATMMAFTAPPTVISSSPVNGATIQSTNTLTVGFNKDMLHDNSAHAADHIANYLLIEANGDGFQTSSCSAGVGGNDNKITFLSAVYDNNTGNGPYQATLGVAPFDSGSYRLLVCGSASIQDLAGNVLNGGEDTLIHFTVAAADQPAELPKTGFPPGLVTQLPKQGLSEMYQQYRYISLEIPSLGVRAPIVGIPLSQDGWDLSWLGDQVGWLHGTAFPSWAGNSALSAHVYNANGQPGPFHDLSRLVWGDKLIVHAFGQSYIYEVREVESYTRPGDTSSVFRHEEYPWLTLITCKGYDEENNSYRWRVIVRAVQIKIN
jgi:LPXTG-site transpeptidase (sortase) family protein